MSKFRKISQVLRYLVNRWKRIDRIEKLYFKNKWHECIAECSISIESGKVDFFYYYYLGLSQFQINFLDESTEHLQQAVSIDTNKKLNDSIKKYRSYATYHIAVNLRKKRDYEQAIVHLNNCIQEEPEYVNFYHLKANIYDDLEKTELAIEAVSDGLGIKPKNKGLLDLQKQLAYSYSLEQSEKRNGG